MATIRTDRHWTIVAQTRAGKTRLLLRAVWLAVRQGYDPAHIHVLNPKRERETADIARRLGCDHVTPQITGRGTVDPELSRALRRWLNEGNHLVIADEVQAVSREWDPDPIWRWWWQMGAGRGCAVWATSTRAAHIPVEAVTEAAVVTVFKLSDPETLRKLDARDGRLRSLVAGLGDYEWIMHALGEDPERGGPLAEAAWKEMLA